MLVLPPDRRHNLGSRRSFDFEQIESDSRKGHGGFARSIIVLVVWESEKKAFGRGTAVGGVLGTGGGAIAGGQGSRWNSGESGSGRSAGDAC